jgi:hypothetical protein
MVFRHRLARWSGLRLGEIGLRRAERIQVFGRIVVILGGLFVLVFG